MDILVENINIKPIRDTELEYKVKWYNDPEIRQYLHYEEEFTLDGTQKWYKAIQNSSTRKEYVIWIEEEEKEFPIGIIGLFDMNMKYKKAGFYITLGNKVYQGKGYAKKATVAFLKAMFDRYDLHKIFLYTDADNISARKLYEKVGFKQEGFLRDELLYKGKYVSRYYYGILKKEFEEEWGR